MWVARTHVLRNHLLLPGVRTNRKVELGMEPESQPSHSNIGYKGPKWHCHSEAKCLPLGFPLWVRVIAISLAMEPYMTLIYSLTRLLQKMSSRIFISKTSSSTCPSNATVCLRNSMHWGLLWGLLLFDKHHHPSKCIKQGQP